MDFIHPLIQQIALEHLLSRDYARHWRINRHTLCSQEFIIKEMRQIVTRQYDKHKQGARPREQREGNTSATRVVRARGDQAES